jgi:putative Ca2+/H+ antiporter (TMEM165/GDT1 family)
VVLGEVAAKKLPMRLVHSVVAIVFLMLGLVILLN